MKKETLVIYNDIDTGQSHKISILSGDGAYEINHQPSYSDNGKNYYYTARLIKKADYDRKWYIYAKNSTPDIYDDFKKWYVNN